MVARRLFGMLVGWVALTTAVVPSASAEPVQRDASYRILWEAFPAYRMVPDARDAVRAPAEADAGRDQWFLRAVGGTAEHPIYQIRNNASQLCLAPTLRRAASSDVAQRPCGTGTEQTWYIDPTGDSYSITLVADPTRKMYANKAPGEVPAVLEGAIADTAQARWIFQRV
ncbi:RICIN domain-containing protein [Nocardia sp. NPDC003482]